MTKDMTTGSPMKLVLSFAIPLMFGNLFQQFYSMVDTIIVGRFLGTGPLAAVGSTGSINFLILGFCTGICAGFTIPVSQSYGAKDFQDLKRFVGNILWLASGFTLVITVLTVALCRPILQWMDTPADILDDAYSYIVVIFLGIPTIVLYNVLASLLRALGDSRTPVIFLVVASLLNIALDLWFVLGLGRGVAGAAEATVISQYVSGLGLGAVALVRCPILRPRRGDGPVRWARVREIASFSLLTCVQQSVMNLGILMVQGLVNSFGDTVMAAFAAAVKIDAFAYLPVQDFGNAFSTFIAQNYGAGKRDRIRAGLRGAVLTATVFSLAVSALVWIFAPQLMALFVEAEETAIIREGVRYLRIEGAFYCGIGLLFLLYGLYRALERPGMSVALTVISLGARVTLAYLLSAVPAFGVAGIWWSVPIGWFLADLTGVLYYLKRKQRLLPDQISESSEKMVSSPR